MTLVLVALVFGLLIGLSVLAARRERAGRAVEAFAADLRERRALEAMFVSKLDRSFIAFRHSDRILVFGDGTIEREVPFSAIRGVEVERDERAHRSGKPEDGWLKRLSVLVQTDDPERPEHRYRILDWPRGRGLANGSPGVIAMNDQAERLRDQILQAMAEGRGA